MCVAATDGFTIVMQSVHCSRLCKTDHNARLKSDILLVRNNLLPQLTARRRSCTHDRETGYT
jgi:hypothetical protein